MTESKAIIAVVGDVIGSREHSDQSRMLQDLHNALQAQAAGSDALEPFRATVGDEFQGSFPRFESALAAVVQLRLALAGRLDLRFGFGYGRVEVHGTAQAPGIRSGPAWWKAREAIEEVVSLGSKHRWPRRVRMRLCGGPAKKRGLVNALFLCVDEVLGKMDERDARVTHGLLQGLQQEELAEQLGISQGSVARRQMENGGYVLFRCLEEMRGATE